MVRGGKDFKVDFKVGIKMDYRGVIREYFREFSDGLRKSWYKSGMVKGGFS